MPCGGIYPAEPMLESPGVPDLPYNVCFHCGKTKSPTGVVPDHYVEEWDALLHRECIEEFLSGPEGEVILNHGHDVLVRTGDRTVLLYSEGRKVTNG